MSPESAAEILKDVLESDKWEVGVTGIPKMTGTTKINRELKYTKCSIAADHLYAIRDKLREHSELLIDQFPRTITVPKFNRHDVGEQYKRHVDNSVISKVRTDLALTLFLTPTSEYDGGALVLETPTGDTARFKLNPGQVIVYPCWLPHHVELVTRGERISAIAWIQSQIRDEGQRELLSYLFSCSERLNEESHTEGTTVGGAVHKLLRMWAE